MKIENLIKEKNLVLTVARKELLEIFFNARKPLSFEEVKDKITMDRATFYRNISKFEDKSIIKSFESNDKKRYYEVQQSPHPHFICNVCNKIECLDEVDVNIKKYIIQDIILKGICQKCN
ncbi:MAG: transcriptional repressor [Sulfurimonas sp.]|nr:transcriptional repressor [Sulfurimonas sp.]